MIQLTANFVVDFPGHCIIAWPEDEDVSFDCEIDDFKVKIKLLPEYSRTKESNDEHWTYILHQAHISISKEEQEAPPKFIHDTQDNINASHSAQIIYFDKRRNSYSRTAQEATNRIIRFFKYKLNTPYLREFPLDQCFQCFQNPKWTNQSGEEVGNDTHIFVANRIPGFEGELGVSKFTKNLAGNLKDALERPLELNLYEELISDAQSALFEGNIRRGVLELAIGCEIIVKRTFFSQNTPAGAAFDYLEDKSLVRVTVIDLIDHIASEAFGRSFRIDHPAHYINIVYLFRCRNKIAHRGELLYRDNSRNYQQADFDTIANWWTSISKLRCWLNEQQ